MGLVHYGIVCLRVLDEGRDLHAWRAISQTADKGRYSSVRDERGANNLP
jgi:hypothetical protein